MKRMTLILRALDLLHNTAPDAEYVSPNYVASFVYRTIEHSMSSEEIVHICNSYDTYASYKMFLANGYKQSANVALRLITEEN